MSNEIKNQLSTVRVRIAPSPTGFLHIGTARTALYNWLFAKKHKGTFIVRIEDTDLERSKPKFEAQIIDSLAWLGLDHDEFYRQRERAPIHRAYLERMLKEGTAFYCSHSKEELEQESEEQKTKKEPPRHICSDRDSGSGEGIIRFKNTATESLIVRDIIRGEVTYEPQLFGDFSLAKNLNEPLYNFVVTIDDAEMKISHVIRGEDHLSNTPKQMLIASALDLPIPMWAHVPLLLAPDKSKLSKRHGAVSVDEYKKKGYTVEALINFLALLGWHPSAKPGEKEQEVFSKDELIEFFELERIQKGGAVAQFEKLDWFNKEHLRRLPEREVIERSLPFISENIKTSLDHQKLERAIVELIPRISVLSELEKELSDILHPPEYSQELLLWKGKITQEVARQNIDEIIKIVSSIEPDDFTIHALESNLGLLAEKNGRGSVLWPFRASLSGKERSMGPFELAAILGKDETLKRLQKAQNVLY